MVDQIQDSEVTIEQRLDTLESELTKRRQSELIKDSMILEYRQALSDAQYKIAILNGQLKLATQPTA